MPQHLTPSWVKSLGSDYKVIHETWIHRMANLTLTAYNSKYSNSQFEEKRDMKNGFRESGICMNQTIAHYGSFGLRELEERSEFMKNKALEIWELPNTTFKPAEKELDNITLDDDVSLSGRQLLKFSYKEI